MSLALRVATALALVGQAESERAGIIAVDCSLTAQLLCVPARLEPKYSKCLFCLKSLLD